MRRQMLLITFAVALFAALMNLEAVVGFLGAVINLISPVVLGSLVAFILNVPMRGFEKHITAFLGKKAAGKEQLVRAASLLLTLLSLVLVIALVLGLVLPELIRSLTSLYELILDRLPDWIAILNSYDIDTSWITEKVAELDVQSLLSKLSSSAGSMLSSVADIAATTVSSVTNAAFSVIIAIYILLSKKDLGRQGRKLLYAHLREETADELCSVMRLIRDTYAKFLSGQCVEALILGGLIFFAFSVMGLPYAPLIAVLTSVCALIPYVGAFVSFSLGALLTLLADPSHVLLCVVVYLVVQFVENQFIYPHVVGSSVGLPPLWILVGALMGGKLMGVLGIIFFIPMVAVVHTLLGEDTNRRLRKKGIRIQ